MEDITNLPRRTRSKIEKELKIGNNLKVADPKGKSARPEFEEDVAKQEDLSIHESAPSSFLFSLGISHLNHLPVVKSEEDSKVVAVEIVPALAAQPDLALDSAEIFDRLDIVAHGAVSVEFPDVIPESSDDEAAYDWLCNMSYDVYLSQSQLQVILYVAPVDEVVPVVSKSKFLVLPFQIATKMLLLLRILSSKPFWTTMTKMMMKIRKKTMTLISWLTPKVVRKRTWMMMNRDRLCQRSLGISLTMLLVDLALLVKSCLVSVS